MSDFRVPAQLTMNARRSLQEGEQERSDARRRLSPEKIEELAAMVAAGKIPTVGWWRRAR